MISFQYPEAYIFLCLLLGLAYALALYFRHYFIKDPTPGQKRLMNFLGVLRFAVIALIAILLLSPFIKSKFTEVQKPVILVLQDNSESVKNSFTQADSLKYVQDFKSMVEKLKSNFDVKEYSFDDDLRTEINFSWDGKLTNISENLNDIIGLYAGQNVGAIVLASDGIYNKGANPLYNPGNLKFPIYTVALGDTTPRRDLRISKVLYNQIVYLNDRFKIRVDAQADNIASAKTSVDVVDYTERGNSKKLESRGIEFSKSKAFLSEDFVISADRAGMNRYQVALRPVEGEFTTANNYMDIFVDVLDSRQKILIVANSPHPDLAAIREAIESNKNYEVTSKFADELQTINPEDYNLIILHQLPSQRFPLAKFLENIKEKSIATLYIIGGQTSLPLLNNNQSALQIKASSPEMNQAIPVLNTDFPLFTLSDDLRMRFAKWPPLYVPFGEFNSSATSKQLLHQKIGSVNTEYPLILFDEAGSKSVIICGEGLWRWKVYDYREFKNHDGFNELMTKTVQYLSVKEDKRQFRVRIAKNVFYENEVISFQAELYNDSYELINEPDVSIRLVDDEGKEFPFIFNKTANAYVLDAGNFPVDNYSFNASVKYGAKELSYSGKFSIVPMQLEAFNTVADHGLLFQLSEKSGGEMFYPSRINDLGEKLSGNNQLKPMIFATYKTESLINLWWLLAIFAGILSLEWFIRKYEGGY